MNTRLRWWLACSVLLLFGLSSCSTSTSTAPTAPGDVTAPFVVSIDPGINDTGIAANADITIIFSEAMDQATSTGNVTLSSGTISSMTWSDDRTLVITHSGWAEGVQVTVTLGAGLTDVAGNAIEAVFAANFWTATATVSLLSSNPADGFEGALRNPQVMMLFSHDMNMTSLNSAITVTNVSTSGTVAYNLVAGEDTWIAMTFPTALQESTPFRVDISTAAQSNGGTNMSVAASFTFTTGADVDTEAPTLVSVVPANGSVISASTGSIRLTFSESLDPNEFSPSSMSAQIWMLMDAAGAAPVWSENNTVVTVALPTPLPAGLPITFDFATYQDPAGNVQTTPLSYSVTVAGTPDYYPLVDGTVHEYMENWSEETPGAATQQGSRSEWIRVEQDAANDFRQVSYPTQALVTAEDWEFFRRTAATIDFRGFHNSDEQGGPGVDVMFTPAITYNKLPWQAQSWNGTSQMTEDGTLLDIDYSVSVLLQEDVAAQSAGGENLMWKNCWKAVLTYELSASGIVQGSGSETLWFAPTVGIVQRESVEDNPGGTRYISDEFLIAP